MEKYTPTATNRTSESPARTIDSRDSTTESIETIVDRKNQQNATTTTTTNNQQLIMENSTNTTNNCNKNSLTNSQISMISSTNDQKGDAASNHIYTSPDLICSKPIKPATIDGHITNDSIKQLSDKLGTAKINHNNTNAIKSKIIKSPLPPAPTGDTDPHHLADNILKSSLIDEKKVRKLPFPINILLGLLQLVLSITLAALGGLLIARGASLASSASGLWAGGICAIAGVLGVINLRKAQTGFLAVSLICVASSTLAMALTGIGLVRDINRLEIAEFNTPGTKAAISAGGGLVFALFLHFIVSIVSVYQSALRLCSRYDTTSPQILDNVITGHNTTMISSQKVEEYIKSMSTPPSRIDKILTHEDYEKLKTMWLYTTKRNSLPQLKVPRQPVMLVPAGTPNGMATILPPGFRSAPPPAPRPIIYPPSLYPPGCVMIPGANSYLPGYPASLPPGSIIHPSVAESIYKLHSIRNGSVVSKNRHLKRRNIGKADPNRRQRSKSESEVENRKAFTYTGLDRAIADSFLERQEQTNAGSHIDYSSSSDSTGHNRQHHNDRGGCPDIAI